MKGRVAHSGLKAIIRCAHLFFTISRCGFYRVIKKTNFSQFTKITNFLDIIYPTNQLSAGNSVTKVGPSIDNEPKYIFSIALQIQIL